MKTSAYQCTQEAQHVALWTTSGVRSEQLDLGNHRQVLRLIQQLKLEALQLRQHRRKAR